jgi:phage terminase large subunit-like protein
MAIPSMKINPNSEQSRVSEVPTPKAVIAPVAVSRADVAGKDAAEFAPLFWDGVTMPRALSAELRKKTPPELAAYAAERHAVKVDPLRLGNILGFDFQEKPHRALFRAMLQIPPVNADGTAVPISSLEKQWRKKLILWPRNSFKTSAVIVLIVQILLNWPDARLLFITGGDGLAKDQLARVKRIFEHPPAEFLRLFPEFCLTSKFDKRLKKWIDVQEPLGTQKKFTVPCRSADNVTAEASVQIFTSKSTKAGTHANFIFGDDLVNDQNYQSTHMLDSVWTTYQNITPLLDPNAGIMILTGTRYSFGDLYERIQEKAQQDGEAGIWKVSVRSCFDYGCMNCLHRQYDHDYSVNIIQPPCSYLDCIGFAKDKNSRDVMFPHATTRKGELIGWDLEFLERLKQDMGASFFANQMENSPIAAENQQFTETMIGGVTLHDMKQFPTYLNSATFALADLGYSESEDSDLSVIYVFRKFQGALWVYKCVCGHWGSAELVANVLKVLRDERPLRLYLEKNLGWEAIDNLIRATAETVGLKSVPLEWIGGAANNRKGAKATRIMGIQGMIANFRLWLFAGMDHYAKLVSQLCKFPRGGHHGDDLADALAMVVESPTGWAMETPPQPISTTNWLHKLHQASPNEDSYEDSGCGTGINCG